MIDQQLFKKIMACAPGPATIVTATGADDRPQGLTVSAVCSVSMDPPLVLVCLDLGSNTLTAVRASNAFTVNYIADGREHVALDFAVKSDSKFDSHTWARPAGTVGGPILTDHCAAYAACRVEQIVAAGDHVIVVGRVVEGDAGDRHALAYARRAFFTGASA
ncbi:flavin reductase-like protein [Nocardia nova SH22a]|uniref:Flavin reductase-like protein n=1 Tax=Nocardia nova SH22a TaxID=1415166 RepID=W5TE72_9NOCA|nr:flavin reductase family protein [Nocardia nova]AHH17444.1 flavin reductase-like protein [Nocardia nova SH22a]